MKYGYVPTQEEFKAELLRMANLFHKGKFGPGKTKWDNVKPKGWAAARRLAIVYKYEKHAAPNWANTVRLVTGLEVIPSGRLPVVAPVVEAEDDEQPYRRVDDNRNHGGGLAYTKVRTVGQREYYLLR